MPCRRDLRLWHRMDLTRSGTKSLTSSKIDELRYGSDPLLKGNTCSLKLVLPASFWDEVWHHTAPFLIQSIRIRATEYAPPIESFRVCAYKNVHHWTRRYPGELSSAPECTWAHPRHPSTKSHLLISLNTGFGRASHREMSYYILLLSGA